MVKLSSPIKLSNGYLLMDRPKKLVHSRPINAMVTIGRENLFVFVEVFFVISGKPHHGYVTSFNGIPHMTFYGRLDNMPLFEKRIPTYSKTRAQSRKKIKVGKQSRSRVSSPDTFENEEYTRLSCNRHIQDKLIKRDSKIAEYVKTLAERKRIEKLKEGLDGIDTRLSDDVLSRIVATNKEGFKDSKGRQTEIA